MTDARVDTGACLSGPTVYCLEISCLTPLLSLEANYIVQFSKIRSSSILHLVHMPHWGKLGSSQTCMYVPIHVNFQHNTFIQYVQLTYVVSEH